jgi:ankyrin repeat protein
VNNVGPRGDTPLLAAINTTTNDLMLQLLLDYNPDLAHVTPERRTALSLAVALGNVSAVTVLEPLPGQDWSITDGSGQTLVHLAVLAQSPAVLQLVLRHSRTRETTGTDACIVDSPDANGNTPLHVAVTAAFRQRLEGRIQAAAPLDEPDDYELQQAINTALRRDDEDVLEGCFDPENVDDAVAEETATLSVTKEEQRAAVARIRAEVKGNATVTKEMVAVRIAAVRVVHAIIEALMRAGADPLTVNNRRRNIFALANEQNASFMSELLLDPTVAQAIEEHRAVEEAIAFRQEEERYRTRRRQISSLRPKPFTAVQKDRRPAGSRPRQTPLEKKDQLRLMTMQSGRLRPMKNLARSAVETKTARASIRSNNTTASSAKGTIDTHG